MRKPEPPRISAREVERKRAAGESVLLVCAYDDEKSFRLSRIDEAISHAEFEARRASLAPDAEIVFY